MSIQAILLFILLLFPHFLMAQNLPVVIEAESGALGSDYEMIDEGDLRFVRPKSDLANGSYPGNDSKVITFSLPFTETGTYHVYARIRVGEGSYNDDSFYLGKTFGSISATSSDGWHLVNGLVPVGHNSPDEVVTGAGNVGVSAWKWVNISAFLNADNPASFSVENTNEDLLFCIGARENGLDIDKIAFGKSHLYFTVENLDKVEAGMTELPDENGSTELAYKQVKTFINPIMPGDHPDMTLLKDGDDFYACGSNFHFLPYLPILHSTDLVHWEEICRVIPANESNFINDAPQAGTWAGVITRFYDSYWIYFSNTAGGGQYFAKASHPAGPWSKPVKVNTTTNDGLGYDNSVFVDDDGTPYMLIKPGQYVNRIQEIGRDGHMTGKILKLDWVNADGKYSWAEGPVMCKRDGWYYYFIAGHVYGGQYVLRSRTLTDDPSSWEALGNFFENVSDPAVTFRSPNHIAQPFQLDDGTWWTISHSYEALGGNNWNGQGRQGMLHQVSWDANGKPTGKAPSTTPQIKPDLPKSGIPWKTPRSDHFDQEAIELSWHFMNRKAAANYTLAEKPGWITLDTGSEKTHILHKESRHHYAIVTKMNVDAVTAGQEAGIYLSNGNESVTVELYSGFDQEKILGFRFGKLKYTTTNLPGNELWLKVERTDHLISGYYSPNGILWTQLGEAINVSDLDKAQENYNWWVGTSNGLYAAKVKAHFDHYAYRDGFSLLPAVAYNNYFGLESIGSGSNRTLTNSTSKGGWLMLAGVDLGKAARVPVKVEAEILANASGTLEIWIDDLENDGQMIAEIAVTPADGKLAAYNANVDKVSGQHDVYLRWRADAKAFNLKSIRFLADDSFYTHTEKMKERSDWKVYPNPFQHTFTLATQQLHVPYTIYTIDGRMAEAGTVQNMHQQIGENLQPGLYLFKLNNKVIPINKIK
ncbi:MAG: family 43 glycosylhydrolase [Prolixibacteraceae bacterium]|nr:family 43 glycosylhydrolase [Prolixibacteraceae bacterium]